MGSDITAAAGRFTGARNPSAEGRAVGLRSVTNRGGSQSLL